MTPQPSTKKPKKKPATLDDLIEALKKQAAAIEALMRSIHLLVRENERLIEVLLEDEPAPGDEDEPGAYLDGTRIS